jgi:hypothetical protein
MDRPYYDLNFLMNEAFYLKESPSLLNTSIWDDVLVQMLDLWLHLHLLISLALNLAYGAMSEAKYEFMVVFN